MGTPGEFDQSSLTLVNGGTHAIVEVQPVPTAWTNTTLHVLSVSASPAPRLLSPNVVRWDKTQSGAHVVYSVDKTPADSSTINAAAEMWHLAVVAGSLRKVGDNTQEYDLPQFSADESRLFLIDGRSNYLAPGTLRSVVSATGTPTTVSSTARGLELSPDKNTVVFSIDPNASTYTGELYALPVTSTSPTRLSGSVYVAHGGQGFSAISMTNGRALYLTGLTNGGSGTLWSQPLTGGSPTQLATNVSPVWNGGNGYGFSISADMQRVLYWQNYAWNTHLGDAWVVPVAGGTPAQLATGAYALSFGTHFGADYFAFAMSFTLPTTLKVNKYDAFGTHTIDTGVSSQIGLAPNASTLTYVVGTARYLYNPTSGGKVALSSSVISSANSSPRYSPDSSRLLFTTDEDTTSHVGTLRVANTSNGSTVLLAQNAYLHLGTFTPNGSKVLYLGNFNALSRRGDVTLRNSDGSNPLVLVTDRTPRDFQFSPDQAFVAFGSEPSANAQVLVIANLTTGRVAEIPDAQPVAWVPGTRRLVYGIWSGPNAGFYLVDVQ